MALLLIPVVALGAGATALARTSGRVQVNGSTSDGDEISEGRTYVRCSTLPKPRPRPEPPAVSGGGEG